MTPASIPDDGREHNPETSRVGPNQSITVGPDGVVILSSQGLGDVATSDAIGRQW
jgi:hypothetical protein